MRRMFLAIAIVAIAFLFASVAQARILSNPGVIMSHGINELATSPMAFVDEYQGNENASWFGWDAPRWLRIPLLPITGPLRMVARITWSGILYPGGAVIVDIFTTPTDGSLDGGAGRPEYPNPRYIAFFVNHSALTPKCSVRWAALATELGCVKH